MLSIYVTLHLPSICLPSLEMVEWQYSGSFYINFQKFLDRVFFTCLIKWYGQTSILSNMCHHSFSIILCSYTTILESIILHLIISIGVDSINLPYQNIKNLLVTVEPPQPSTTSTSTMEQSYYQVTAPNS